MTSLKDEWTTAYGRGVMENVAALQQLFLLSAPFKGANKSHALCAWLFTDNPVIYRLLREYNFFRIAEISSRYLDNAYTVIAGGSLENEGFTSCSKHGRCLIQQRLAVK